MSYTLEFEEKGKFDLRFGLPGREDRLIRRAIVDVQNAIYVDAARRAPGSLARAISRRRPYAIGDSVTARISLTSRPRHALWVHEGTGLFGPRHSPIVSPRGNLMTFIANGRRVFTRSTVGQRPQPFFREAVEAMRHTYIPARMKQLGLEIRAEQRS